MRLELVVVDETAAKLEALAVVVVVAEATVHWGAHGITSACHRGVAALAVREVKLEVRTEVDSVARVNLPLESEVTTNVMGLVKSQRESVAVACRVVEDVLSASAGACVAASV